MGEIIGKEMLQFENTYGEVRVIEKAKEEHSIIRVAAYCRVSTDLEMQQTSLDTQIASFRKIITERPGWTLAGIYADKGISGTSVKHREEFKRMVADAREGKIDYIIAKSISRFARNTVDTLAYVRELKSYGVSVFFEKEKLDTGNAVSEFLLSIFAAAAQEEIISLSNNMKVGRRMRYAAGIAPWVPLYGFRKGENGEHLIDENEAAIVRRVFREYIAGSSLPEICRSLEKDRIPSMSGKTKWYPICVSEMLHNERYIGDLRMQKSYISDPIQHTQVSNRDAKVRQYYKENHHVAIIDRESYQMAQTIAALKDMHRGTSQYPYYGFLKCPICGERMIRFQHPRNNHAFAWTCGGKTSVKGSLRRDRTDCPAYFILEPYIDAAFLKAIQMLNLIGKRTIKESLAEQKTERVSRLMEYAVRCHAKEKPRIEYILLNDLVDSISFPTWTKMEVSWKCGLVSTVEIEYKKLTDQPFPTISLEEHVRRTRNSRTTSTAVYLINGVPLLKGCPSRQVSGIMRARKEVQDLIILEPFPYEPDVPRVFSARTCAKGEKIDKERRKKRYDSKKDCQKGCNKASSSVCQS